MQPSSKSRTWANEIKDIKGDTLGQQDITVNEEVDGHGLVTSPNDAEYQEVPHKHKKPRDNINEASQSPEQQSPFDAVQEDTESSPAPKIAPPAGDPEATTITDNDWLRSRTSRLLGLVDDVGPAFEDTHTSERRSKGEASGGDRRRSNSETSDAGMQVDAGLVEQADTEARPAELETNTTATATGRLFVRNLPYAVTDQQLRHHFEQLGLGKLEEVIVMPLFLQYKLARSCTWSVMNILIGTTYASLHVMLHRNSILVDALSSLRPYTLASHIAFNRCPHGLANSGQVHIPIDHRSGKNKGFAYVQYSEPEAATKTLQHLDGKPFGGRLLHIISSAAKRPSGLDEIAISKLPLKKQQQIKRKAAAASSTFNWNSMYMNVRKPDHGADYFL